MYAANTSAGDESMGASKTHDYYMHTDAGSLMCLVVTRSDLTYLERLLRFGLSANSRDYDGRTGLHITASQGHTEAVMLLLSKGADPSPIDNFGRTPLLEAVRSRQEPAARLL